MLFLSYWFVLFALVGVAAHRLVRPPILRLGVLILACLAFQAHFAGPAGIAPILVLGTVTYLLGLSGRPRARTVGVVLCTASLLFYRYMLFLAHGLFGAVGFATAADAGSQLAALVPAAPPLGISFFVFEFVHYLVDLNRGSTAIRNPLHFWAFALFWPSMVAGPIKRFQQFLPALREGLARVQSADLAMGVLLVGSGLGKKFVADTLAAYLDFWVPHFGTVSVVHRWGLVLAMGVRILCDFSGYSDMAIGFARMHGIRLPANFNWPYLATDLTEFWRRWHISLSSWIRDYVYVPMGRLRHGLRERVIMGLVTFALMGLWHGAAWNFVWWGAYHGVGFVLSSNYPLMLGQAGPRLAAWLRSHRFVGWLLTMVFVQVGWLLFFHPASQAAIMMRMLIPRVPGTSGGIP